MWKRIIWIIFWKQQKFSWFEFQFMLSSFPFRLIFDVIWSWVRRKFSEVNFAMGTWDIIIAIEWFGSISSFFGFLLLSYLIMMRWRNEWGKGKVYFFNLYNFLFLFFCNILSSLSLIPSLTELFNNFWNLIKSY